MKKPSVQKPRIVSGFSLSRKLPKLPIPKSAPDKIASPPKPKLSLPPTHRKK